MTPADWSINHQTGCALKLLHTVDISKTITVCVWMSKLTAAPRDCCSCLGYDNDDADADNTFMNLWSMFVWIP